MTQWISTHDDEGNEWMIPAGSAWRVISQTDSPDGDETIMTLESAAGKRMAIGAIKLGEVARAHTPTPEATS